MTTNTTTTGTSRTRPGPTIVVAAALLVLQALVSGAGMVYFGLFYGEVGVGAVFTAVGIAQHATGLATLPGLLRGARTPWLVAIGYAWSYSFWSVYKTFAEGETSSTAFLVVGLALLGLLLAPATRRRISPPTP